jgi:hypothetical protein
LCASPLNPDVADLAPCDPVLTVYDEEHAITSDFLVADFLVTHRAKFPASRVKQS